MERKDLAPFMTTDEHCKMAESHKTYFMASWIVVFCSVLLLATGVAVLAHIAYPIILKVSNWSNILMSGFFSLLLLLLLMLMQKRKSQEMMRTIMIRAAFKARRSEEQ